MCNPIQDAYLDGHAAFYEGKNFDDHQFPVNSREAMQFRNAWFDARDAKQRRAA